MIGIIYRALFSRFYFLLLCRLRIVPRFSMKSSNDVASPAPVVALPPDGQLVRWNLALPLALGGVIVAFALPLFRLFTFAAYHELFSYIVLIPFVSGYWLWMDRASLHLLDLFTFH